MELTMSDVIQGVINKGAGSTLFGGKRARGPNRTADFIYEVMIGVALELTDKLPMLFEQCRQDYEKKKKWNENFTKKGLYTDSYGWSPNREFRHDIDINPVLFNYFNRIIVPFMGGAKKRYNDENSRIWKRVKRMIITGDKERISKLQQGIKNRILKEAKKRIMVGQVGSNNSNIITEKS